MNRNKADNCKDINEIRKHIDLIDHQIIKLFAERESYVKKIVHFKNDEKEVIARERKEFVIKERAQLAAKLGLDEALFEKIFTVLVEHNIKKELEILQQKTLNNV